MPWGVAGQGFDGEGFTGSQGTDGKWNKFGGRLAWDNSVICANNPSFGGRGARKSEDDYTAAPNIDHTNEQVRPVPPSCPRSPPECIPQRPAPPSCSLCSQVRSDLTQWMQYLKNRVGFDGWRFDFVKGYSGVWAREYIDGTVPEMAFGEYWDTMEYGDGVLSYNQVSRTQCLGWTGHR